ncbi:MAG: hypothetical protein DHS20C21_12650 [Gemmatimonadota bacterium]|nr:MAG: hypothetical protein DHS20C21_12650 [Gemmatimonadota bacterium]
MNQLPRTRTRHTRARHGYTRRTLTRRTLTRRVGALALAALAAMAITMGSADSVGAAAAEPPGPASVTGAPPHADFGNVDSLAVDSLAVEPGPPDLVIQAPRWIFAVEDTADLPAFFETSIEVKASRLKIGDIVQRCIEREEMLRRQIQSHEYTTLVHSTFYVGGRDESAQRRLVTEQVVQHFFRKPDQERSVPLRFEQYELSNGERKEWNPDDDGAVEISYSDFDDLPFYLKDRRQYDFKILSREIVGDRVIYEVQLAPKSDFEIAPSGRIWIDSSNFQILREEFDFADRVPMPMFIKSVGPFIRERERVGDLWVWKRFLVRVDLRMGYLRFLDDGIPDRAEFSVEFANHRINQGWSIDAKESTE